MPLINNIDASERGSTMRRKKDSRMRGQQNKTKIKTQSTIINAMPERTVTSRTSIREEARGVRDGGKGGGGVED